MDAYLHCECFVPAAQPSSASEAQLCAELNMLLVKIPFQEKKIIEIPSVLHLFFIWALLAKPKVDQVQMMNLAGEKKTRG